MTVFKTFSRLAKNKGREFNSKEKSLINIKNKSDPRLDPCGTYDITKYFSDLNPLYYTNCYLLIK